MVHPLRNCTEWEPKSCQMKSVPPECPSLNSILWCFFLHPLVGRIAHRCARLSEMRNDSEDASRASNFGADKTPADSLNEVEVGKQRSVCEDLPSR